MPRKRVPNASMEASKYGSIKVNIEQIGYGINVVPGESASDTRFGRAFYPYKRSSGSFGITIVCTSYAEYAALGKWIQGYGRKAAVPGSGVGPMRVRVPSRNFDKVAIPSGVTFGDSVGQFVYRVSISFGGSRDPIALWQGSRFLLPGQRQVTDKTPKDMDPAIPYFYPAGIQLRGAAHGADSLYDEPPVVPHTNPKLTPTGQPRGGRPLAD